MQTIFIDRFIVPGDAKDAFLETMNLNRNFIKTLVGFITDTVYQRENEQGDCTYITIAEWESEEALQKAKEAVQADYKRQGLHPAEMLDRLKITMERGIYYRME